MSKNSDKKQDNIDKNQSLVEDNDNMEAEAELVEKDTIQDIDAFFKSYRRNLAIRIISGFAVLFLLILELVFHRTIYSNVERDWIYNI
jgi:hypothetical protein